MAIRFTARAMMRNMGAAHSVKGIGGAYAKRAIIGGTIGGIGGGTLEAVQGGSFGEGFVKGGIGGAAVGAGSVAFTAAGLGKGMFEKGTSRIAKGSLRNSGSSIARIHRDGQLAGRMCKEGSEHIKARMATMVNDKGVVKKGMEDAHAALQKQLDFLGDVRVGKAHIKNTSGGYRYYDYAAKKSIGTVDDDIMGIYNSYYGKSTAGSKSGAATTKSASKNRKSRVTKRDREAAERIMQDIQARTGTTKYTVNPTTVSNAYKNYRQK